MRPLTLNAYFKRMHTKLFNELGSAALRTITFSAVEDYIEYKKRFIQAKYDKEWLDFVKLNEDIDKLPVKEYKEIKQSYLNMMKILKK